MGPTQLDKLEVESVAAIGRIEAESVAAIGSGSVAAIVQREPQASVPWNPTTGRVPSQRSSCMLRRNRAMEFEREYEPRDPRVSGKRNGDW